MSILESHSRYRKKMPGTVEGGRGDENPKRRDPLHGYQAQPHITSVLGSRGCEGLHRGAGRHLDVTYWCDIHVRSVHINHSAAGLGSWDSGGNTMEYQEPRGHQVREERVGNPLHLTGWRYGAAAIRIERENPIGFEPKRMSTDRGP